MKGTADRRVRGVDERGRYRPARHEDRIVGLISHLGTPRPTSQETKMRMPASALLVALSSVGFSGTTAAQTVDLGRGELPLHVPSSYSAETPEPLVVLLHGYGSNGARQVRYWGLDELVDSHGFLLVSPDGTEQATGRKPRFWNASPACCNFAGSDVDDVAYVLAIIDDVASRYSVDPDRVYLVGHSNGGFMSHRIAYEHPGTIAAIASLAGAGATEAGPAPSGTVHVLQIHGTDDDTIAYDGGEIGGNAYPSAAETVRRWARYNGCVGEGEAADARLDLDREIEGPETTVLRYRGCAAGGSSELWTIQGGPHTPPLSDSYGRQVIEWLLAHPKQ